MPTNGLQQAVDAIREMAAAADAASLGDRALLQRFINEQDHAAFEVLVRRHGPMILGVCRRILQNRHDAEDAFQATFLVFVRKVRTLVHPELLSNWLYTIAFQTARAARAAAQRRRVKESQVTPRHCDPAIEDWSEIQPLLEEEINRLPAKYRTPLVMCALQQKSRAEVARLLGVPPGTLSSRLARARSMLARRLRRRGITVPRVTIAAAFASANPSPSAALVQVIVKAGIAMRLGSSAAAGIGSAQAVKLSEMVIKTMFLSKLKLVGAVVLTCALLTASAGALVAQRWGQDAAGRGEVATLPSRQQVQAAVGNPKTQVGEVRSEEREPIKVVLKLNRKEFLLGESIAVEYEITNGGTTAARYGQGALYPDLRFNDGYRVSAVKVDENGKQIGEPVASWPLPRSFDGPSGNFEVKPGEKLSTPLIVTRYLKFLQPGRYRLRIENVDRFDRTLKKSYSAGETYFAVKEPTPQEARRVFEQMKQAPRKAYDDNAMRFLPEAADFQAIHQPIYLPVLKEFAAQFDRDALESLERMEQLGANEVLVATLARALDRDDWRTARACFHHLQASIPFPNWFDEPLSEDDRSNRDRVARLWKADFAPTMTRLAKRLNVEVTSLMAQRKSKPPDADANDLEFLEAFRGGRFPPEHPQSLLIDIDFIYRCLGQPVDFGDCLAAFAHSIELTKTLPLETHQYFRPRGSAYGFRSTVMYMLRRGAKVPNQPALPGEAAAFVIALRTQASFRPAGWQAELITWLKSDSPYLAEVILDYFPEPVPAEVLDYLPTALAHDYIDLQIAACHIAAKHPRQAYREPLQKILDTAKEKYLREFAAEAARANGI